MSDRAGPAVISLLASFALDAIPTGLVRMSGQGQPEEHAEVRSEINNPLVAQVTQKTDSFAQ